MTLSKTQQVILGLATVAIALGVSAGIIFYSAQTAESASPTFVRVATTGGTGAFASSSASYMTAGNATTSLTYDAYAANGTGEVNGQMTFTLNIQMAPVSVVTTTYCRSIQISNDGVDWYPIAATTTEIINTGLNDQCFKAASTSPSLAAGTHSVATTTQSAQIPILSRYTRVLFYMPLSSTRGALWAEAIGVKPRI